MSYNELGGNSQNPIFSEETDPSDYLEYLAIPVNRIIKNSNLENVAWWTRSGSIQSYRNASYVNASGGINDAYISNNNYAVGRVNI